MNKIILNRRDFLKFTIDECDRQISNRQIEIAKIQGRIEKMKQRKEKIKAELNVKKKKKVKQDEPSRRMDSKKS